MKGARDSGANRGEAAAVPERGAARRPALLAAALLAATVLSACTTDRVSPDAGTDVLDVTVGAVRLEAHSSAAVLVGNVFHLFVSDEANACLGVGLYPTLTRNRLTLMLAMSADGSPVARVVPPQVVPGPGQAVGSLQRTTGQGPPDASYDAVDGTVTWTANADGSVTVSDLDVGFAGTNDRLRGGGFTIPRCTPP